MLARIVFGAVLASSFAAPVLAENMNADEARKFVANKMFAFTCFDGTKGVGKITEDGAAAGAVQFSGAPQARNMRLPSNTLQVRGQQICASIKGIPFEPCFNLDKKDERSFRGSVSGMGFAYCDFNHQGGRQMLLTRAVAHPHSHRRGARTADATSSEVTARVETPRVESAAIAPVKPEAKSEPAKAEGALELRRSTD